MQVNNTVPRTSVVNEKMPSVAVVMATYNGELYLRDQVNSIFTQQDVAVSLFIYDDCSTDGTVALLGKLTDEYRNMGFDINVRCGASNVGFPTSFFSALNFVNGSFDYFAYSDQDDVWKPDKLITAIKSISNFEEKNGMVLYFEPTTAVDEQLNYLFERQLDSLHLDLSAFFVRARVAAHTMVFDNQMKQELCRLGIKHNGFSHGWLALLIAAAAKASIIVGDTSHTLHRRLSSSVSAGGQGVVKRIAFEWNSIFKPEVDRSSMAAILREAYSGILTKQEDDFLFELATYKKSFCSKIRLLSPKNYKTDLCVASFEAVLSILFNCY